MKNQISINGRVAKIELQYGGVCEVDVSDLPLLSNYHWRLIRSSKQDRKGYAASKYKVDGGYAFVLMHRLLMDAPKGLDVDHIDGNGINNRRGNLRLATRSQNLANQKIGRANKSGHKGVSWDSERQKWTAKVMQHGKTYNLGRFKHIDDAAAAYLDFAKQRFSEFARQK